MLRPVADLGADAPGEPACPRRYRSIWISDVHLGTRTAQAGRLLGFLRATESEHLYIVGDLVDGWRLKSAWYWPQAHADVVQALLAKARGGTQVTYVPGNHDEGFRDYVGLQFGAIRVARDCVHTTADGKRLLIIHGDEFDVVVNNAKWIAFVGDAAYRMAMGVNVVFNWGRRRLGFGYWSLSAYLKHRVKAAVEIIGGFETALANEARRRGVDGVVCGHIHHAEIRDMAGILYCNDGDWVESCTALVEDEAGALSILRWADAASVPLPTALSEAA